MRRVVYVPYSKLKRENGVYITSDEITLHHWMRIHYNRRNYHYQLWKVTPTCPLLVFMSAVWLFVYMQQQSQGIAFARALRNIWKAKNKVTSASSTAIGWVVPTKFTKLIKRGLHTMTRHWALSKLFHSKLKAPRSQVTIHELNESPIKKKKKKDQKMIHQIANKDPEATYRLAIWKKNWS